MANVYGFDPAAWSVDGATHRGELLRVLAYAATGGSEGIVSPGDCKVHQLTTPGGQVAIDAGALLVRNRSANVRNQTYAANGRIETRLDVTPTTTAGRSDLVVVRIEDPQYAGWTQPSEAEAPDYQYVKPFIIQNVPASTDEFTDLNLSYSAVALARLDIPANTSTITNAMIKDLRKLAQPKSLNRNYGGPPDIQADVTYGSSPRPVEPGDPQQSIALAGGVEQVEIPAWATHMDVVAIASSIIAGVYNNPSAFPANLGAALVRVGPNMVGPLTNWDFRTGGNEQLVATVTDLAIPTSERGKTLPMSLRVRMDAGQLSVTRWSTIVYMVAFYERAA